ncbi:MAG: nucleotide exchange factor GrpE [Solirubrobacterales bacterium]
MTEPNSTPEPIGEEEALTASAAGEMPAVDAADSEATVEQDIEDLVIKAQTERDEYLDLAQRTKADFENFRKRMTTETAAAAERGRLEVVGGVIEAIDNLERVMENEGILPQSALDGGFPDGAAVSLQGVIVAYRDLHSTLRKVKVEAFDPAGEAFDPNLHEALQAIPSEEVESGIVVEVMQRGYRAGEQVIRPARVVVSQ